MKILFSELAKLELDDARNGDIHDKYSQGENGDFP